jgi:hypothetical protein
MRSVTYALLFLLSAFPVTAKRFDLDALSQIVRLSDPQLSPDGKWIAVLVDQGPARVESTPGTYSTAVVAAG